MVMKQMMIVGLLSFFCFSAEASAHGGGHDVGSNAHDKIPVEVEYNRVYMSEKNGFRYIESNGIPSHETGAFPNAGNPNRITEQSYNFRVNILPRFQEDIVWLSEQRPPYYFGVALNGIPFDPATAESWNNDPRSGWNEEAIVGGQGRLGLDQSNAHVQPDGSYHYHGIPWRMLKAFKKGNQSMVLVGYAADGFPIYMPSEKGKGLKPSYRLKSGTRPSGPKGRYDGTYTQDYEYVQRSGDLDECNGLISHTDEYPYGSYMYVLTEEFPFVPRCWRGRVDTTFEKKPLRRDFFGKLRRH